jgi:hypothetical protein
MSSNCRHLWEKLKEPWLVWILYTDGGVARIKGYEFTFVCQGSHLMRKYKSIIVWEVSFLIPKFKTPCHGLWIWWKLLTIFVECTTISRRKLGILWIGVRNYDSLSLGAIVTFKVYSFGLHIRRIHTNEKTFEKLIVLTFAILVKIFTFICLIVHTPLTMKNKRKIVSYTYMC